MPEPTFELSWDAGQPAPRTVQGWPALAKATRLKVASLRAYLSGANGHAKGICARTVRNPETGEPGVLTITKLGAGSSGRPTGFHYVLTKAGHAPIEFTDIAAAAKHLGVKTSTLRHYMTVTKGSLVRDAYVLQRVDKPAPEPEPPRPVYANKLRNI